MDERLIKAIDTLLLSAVVLYSEGLIYALNFYEKEKQNIGQTIETEYIERPVEVDEEPSYQPIELEAVNEVYELRNTVEQLPLSVTIIELTYLGKYFVTAYASEELGGSTATSSGVTCHYSDDPLEPTTCAVDLKHGRRYGEVYYIEGKLYIAEDTGAFSGAWIDVYVPDLDSVYSWNTGYKSTYLVTFKTIQVEGVRYEKFRRSHNSL